MRRIRVPLVLLGLALLAAGCFVVAARSGLLTASDETLRQTYALPMSQFRALRGPEVHYTDEGSGPPVVLIHGSYGSLRSWNDWARILARNHRVIRFDRPTMGLSGAATLSAGRLATELHIIAELNRRLGLGRFAIVGTSSGGEAAAAYAAEHPAEISAVILSNIAPRLAVMKRSTPPTRLRWLIRIDPLLGGWRPEAFWREVLKLNFHDPGQITDALVTEWTALNNRAQRLPRSAPPAGAPAPFARTAGDLANIRAPALVLWSQNDHEVPLETAGRETFNLLGSRDKMLEVVPDCGHMLPLECGAASAQIAADFLAARP